MLPRFKAIALPLLLIVSAYSVFFSPVLFPSAHASPVKLSRSGICHEQSSPSYLRTKNFTAFDCLAACLQSGGRLPKNAAAPAQAIAEAEQEGRLYSTPYNRRDYPHWLDRNGDCRNTRAELLVAMSVKPVSYRDERECVVDGGKWQGVYSGEKLYAASDIDIDHIVPLSWAHGRGAWRWSREQKAEFANDWDNLLPVSASLNRQKGDKGPDEWMPPAHDYRCEYLSVFDSIVDKYQLEYVPAERRIISRMLQACGEALALAE